MKVVVRTKSQIAKEYNMMVNTLPTWNNKMKPSKKIGDFPLAYLYDIQISHITLVPVMIDDD